MGPTRRRRLATAAVASVLLVSADGRAETPPLDVGPPTKCTDPTLVPDVDGLALPANTPAFAYEPTRTDGAGTASIEDVRLETPSGTPIPTMIEPDPIMPGITLVRIVGTLGDVTGGASWIRWNQRCMLASTDVPTTAAKTRTFYIKDAITGPFDIGSVYVMATYPELRIRVVFSVEQKDFLPVTAITYGLYGEPPPATRGYGGVVGPALDVRFDPCLGRVGAITHEFELKAHIAGSSFDPAPLEKSIAVSCPGATADGGADVDGTASDGRSDVVSSTDVAGEADDGAAEAVEETIRAGCFCTSTGSVRLDGPAFVAPLALLVITVRRGRRRNGFAARSPRIAP